MRPLPDTRVSEFSIFRSRCLLSQIPPPCQAALKKSFSTRRGLQHFLSILFRLGTLAPDGAALSGGGRESTLSLIVYSCADFALTYTFLVSFPSLTSMSLINSSIKKCTISGSWITSSALIVSSHAFPFNSSASVGFILTV